MKIEKGVPIPRPEYGPRGSKYPWYEMELGDCLFFEGGDQNQRRKAVINTTQSANRWLKAHHPEWRATARNCPDGVRIWFVEADDKILGGQEDE